MIEKTAHDRHLDELAKKIASQFEGERYFDVASVCAAIAVFAISEGFSSNRRQAFETLIAFMRERFERTSLN